MRPVLCSTQRPNNHYVIRKIEISVKLRVVFASHEKPFALVLAQSIARSKRFVKWLLSVYAVKTNSSHFTQQTMGKLAKFNPVHCATAQPNHAQHLRRSAPL